MRTLRTFTLCSLAFLAGCGLAPQQEDGDIVVIGDSVLAWNQGGVGREIGFELGRNVVTRATLGARVRASPAARLVGLSVPHQLSAGNWNWIVINGGANDLASSCGCANCDDVINALISADGETGSIPDLISQARQTGARVVWLGYYQAPESSSFKGCRSGLVEMESRIQTYAKSRSGVFFIDAENVFDANDPSLLAGDKTHPSPEGSRILGSFLARAISEEP